MLFKHAAIFGGILAAAVAPPSKNVTEGEVGQVVKMEIIHETSGAMGTVTIGLFEKDLPKTTENFVWACENHFAGSTLHRVIPGFMAQGGDFTNHNGTGGMSKFGENFKDESFMYKHSSPGALSMANRGPNTNGSQFFLTFEETPWLDGRHVVFGCVTDNFNVVKKIEGKGSRSGKTDGKITIKSCTVEKASPNTKCYSPTSSKSDL